MTPAISFSSSAVPQSFTLDGYLTQTGTDQALLDSQLKLTVQILDPSKNCLLYQETHEPVNTSLTNGYFNIRVGSLTGSPKRSGNDPGLSMVQVFQNSHPVTVANAPSEVCNGGSLTYSPTSADVRYFRLIVTPSSTNLPDTLTPDAVIDSVPQALVAERAENLQGFGPSQFIQTNTMGLTVLNQTNIESIFNTTYFPRLSSLLSVNPTDYILASPNGSLGLPLVTSGSGNPSNGLQQGQIWYDDTNDVLKYYDGGIKTISANAGLTNIDFILPNIFNVTGSPLTANGSISATLTPQSQNQFLASPANGGSGVPTFRSIETIDLPTVGSQGLFMNGGNSFGTAANLGTNDNQNLNLVTNNTSKVSILANGNVGIGKSNPGAPLDIKGEMRLSGSTSGYIGFRTPVDAGSTTYTWPTTPGSPGQVLTTDGTGSLTWASASWTQPNTITFTDQTGVNQSTMINSNTVTLSGFSGLLPAVCHGCVGIIRNGVLGSTMSAFLPGDTVALRLQSSSSATTTVTATLTVGSTVSSTWSVTTGTSPANAPDPFNFLNQTNVQTNSTISSNMIQVGGFTGPLTATCTGCTNIALNGTWAGSTTVANVWPGNYLTMAQTSSASVSTTTSATLTLGSTISMAWTVTTSPNGDPCYGGQAIGTVCADGSVYAGLSPDGNEPMYTQRCDLGMTWNGAFCTGSRTLTAWNNGSTTWYLIGLSSAVTGKSNTLALIALGNSPAPAPYGTANACANSSSHGRGDWYVPARNELNVLFTNRAAIGSFDTSSVYWSATESTDQWAWIQNFSTGTQNQYISKNQSNPVRCVRR